MEFASQEILSVNDCEDDAFDTLTESISDLSLSDSDSDLSTTHEQQASTTSRRRRSNAAKHLRRAGDLATKSSGQTIEENDSEDDELIDDLRKAANSPEQHACLHCGIHDQACVAQCSKRRGWLYNGRGNIIRAKHREIRASDCSCDHIATRFDRDGLPVTDVDLVTYKDLCQMEQANRMRTTNRPQRQNSSTGQYTLKPNSLANINIRRSSLQEESGAYYQLCISNEEQNIRRKYLWFPPALHQLELVDKFFANFPKDKIPLLAGDGLAVVVVAASSGGDGHSSSGASGLMKVTEVNTASSAAAAAEQPVTPPIIVTTSPPTTANSSAAPVAALAPGSRDKQVQQPQQALHPATGFYRDEQISYQLPRQDISLDYCSYPMDEAGRLAYEQFVERRDTHALDVGTVVQIGLSPNSIGSKESASTSASKSGSRAERLSTFQRSGSQTPIENRHERQRKASTVSQMAAMGALTAFSQQQQHQLDQRQQQGPQRCRRCLVRFEDKQLAVVAPNFIIGSAIYLNHQRPPQSPPVRIERDRSQLKAVKGHQTESPATNAALFHPTCFTCSTCKEFLVDLVYCLRDNKLYCLRHYGESLRPRCNWCQEVNEKQVVGRQMRLDYGAAGNH